MLKAGPKGGGHGSLPEFPVDDVEWFEHVTGTTLYSWQRDELRKAMAPDRPRSYYLQIARKNGKSYLAAAVGICEARRPGRHIYMVSDSERSLNSALFREMRLIIQASPVLSAAFVSFQTKFEIPSTGSFIQANPNKHAAAQGLNPHVVLFDECHLQRDQEIWGAYKQSTVGRPDGMVYGITTPGQDVNGPAHGWYQLVRSGAMAGRIFEPPSPSSAYKDREQWVPANPRLMDDPTFMAALEENHAAPDLPEYQFKRYHLGMWTAGATAWLKYGAWDAQKYPRTLKYGDPVWLGFDGSVTGDSTALVAMAPGGHLTVLACWEKPGTADWQVPKDEVIAAVERAFADYDVTAMYMDTAYWRREFQEWDRTWPGRVVEFRGTPKEMGPACEAFRAAVTAGTISHDGDTRMGRHVGNAVIRETPYGFVITKPTKDSPAKIDLAWAAVAAYAASGGMPAKVTPITVW